jgi:hypothetical protein
MVNAAGRSMGHPLAANQLEGNAELDVDRAGAVAHDRQAGYS